MKPASSGRKYPLLILLILSLIWGLINDRETAYSHPMNNGFSELQVGLTSIDFELFLPSSGLLMFDADGDSLLSETDLTANREAIGIYVKQHLQIKLRGKPLPMEIRAMETAEKDSFPGLTLQLQFISDEVIQDFIIDYRLLFDDTDPQHVNFVLIGQGEAMDQAVLDSAHRTYSYKPLHPVRAGQVWWTYFNLGVHHILTGYDHLLFLFTLLVAVSRIGEALRIITAFTLAHSAALLFSAAGLLHPSPRFVEALIALSICLAALDNMRRRPFSGKQRLWLTFGFGLIHGLGFAGALQEIGLSQGHLAGSLISFNLGVEAGQLAITAVVLPLILLIARKEPYRKAMLVGSSFVILALALYWTAERLRLFS